MSPTSATSDITQADGKKTANATYKTVREFLQQSPQSLKDLYEELKALLLAMRDDVQEKELQLYIAFKRIKNFCCVEVHPSSGKLLAFVKVNPASIKLEAGFTRDVSNIGHFGTGDLEITIKTSADLECAKPYLISSYEAS